MDNDRKTHHITPAKGLRYMIICAVCDSSVGMLIKLLPWNPFVIAGLRSALASFLLLVYYKKVGIELAVTRRSVLAGLMISAMFISFVSATRITTAANVVALQFSNPIFIILLTFLIYRQKPSRRDLLTVTGVIIGIIMIFGGSMTYGGMFGNFLALFSGLCLAGMFLYNNRVKNPAEHYSALIIGHFITFLISIFFLFTSPPVFTLITTLAILGLGVIQQTVANILYAYAIRACKPLVCSLILTLQLVLNPVLVFLIVGETPTLIAAFGCGIILLVSATTIILNARSQEEIL